MPRIPLTDDEGLAILAEAHRSGRSPRAVALEQGIGDDRFYRWKKGFDTRAAAGQVQPFRPNFKADLLALRDRLQQSADRLQQALFAVDALIREVEGR